MNRSNSEKAFEIQKKVLIVTFVLFILKAFAWWFTKSVSILSDTLEYSVNLVSSIISLYALRLASMPRDRNHPYGHGKAEFLSSSIEATLMGISSFLVIFQAVMALLNPLKLEALDGGLALTFLSGVCNYFLGRYAQTNGQKFHSLALKATSEHLKADTLNTLAIVIGLGIMHFSGVYLLDPLLAIFFAVMVLVSAWKMLRKSVAGIMDETDPKLVTKIAQFLEKGRRQNWIDIHHLRIVKYGSHLHIDAHLTIPWFFSVREAHAEMDLLNKLVKDEMGNHVEISIHNDPCLPSSCSICSIQSCLHRESPAIRKMTWNPVNIMANAKHTAL